MRVLIAAAIMLAASLAGCAGTTGDDGFETPPTDSQGRYVITVGSTDSSQIFTFTPTEAKVPAGATVVWKLAGTTPHDVQADDGTFDSGVSGGLNETGQEYVFTFSTTGTFGYFCELHGKSLMSGTLRVG